MNAVDNRYRRLDTGLKRQFSPNRCQDVELIRHVRHKTIPQVRWNKMYKSLTNLILTGI